MKLIKITITLANQPPLSEKDLGDRCKVWLDALENIIPIDDLKPSFDLALKNHSSSFPLNAFEMISAWNEIKAEREKPEPEKFSDYTPPCPNMHRNPKTAMMKVVNPFNFDEDITLPCGFCRPHEYEEARREFINTSGEIKPLDILNNVVNGDFGKTN